MAAEFSVYARINIQADSLEAATEAADCIHMESPTCGFQDYDVLCVSPADAGRIRLEGWALSSTGWDKMQEDEAGWRSVPAPDAKHYVEIVKLPVSFEPITKTFPEGIPSA